MIKWLSELNDTDNQSQETQKEDEEKSRDSSRNKYNIDILKTKKKDWRSKKVEIRAKARSPRYGKNTYAGKWPTKIMEHKKEKPDSPLWIGYIDKNPIREIPIKKESLRKHTLITGKNGTGKTSMIKNMSIQVGISGEGACIIDPHGELAEDLLLALPEHRLDDIVWFEIGKKYDGKEMGLNVLEVDVEKSNPIYDDCVDMVVENIVSFLRDGESWGPSMESLAESMTRAMVESTKPYTLIDMYEILIDDDEFEKFVSDISDEGHNKMETYLRHMKKNSQRGRDALLRRLQRLIHNRRIKEILEYRESSINIKQLIQNDKIVIVKNNLGDEKIKKLIANLWIRRIWGVKKQMNEEKLPKNKDPYYLIIDEFASIISDEMNIQHLITDSRKMGIPLILCVHYPSMLPKQDAKAIKGNTENLIAMGLREGTEAGLLASPLNISANKIQNLKDYSFYTGVKNASGRRVTVKGRSFAPYPPVRTPEEAEEIKKESIRKYGTEKRDKEKASEVSSEEVEQGFVAYLRKKKVNDEIPVRHSELTTELSDVLDAPETHIDNVSEKLEGHLIETKRKDGEYLVSLTEKGKEQVETQDSGGHHGGKKGHRKPLRKIREELEKHDYIVEVPEQDGSRLPDAVARPTQASSLDLTNGREANIEVENTNVRNPSRILRNLSKALEENRKCIFVVGDSENLKDKAQKIRRFVSNPYKTVDGDKCLYPSGPLETENGTLVYSKDANTKWMDKGTEVELRIGDESIATLEKDTINGKSIKDYLGLHQERNGKHVVMKNGDRHEYESKQEFKEDWTTVSKPFIPQERLGDYGAEDWMIILVPGEDNNEYDEPQVYGYKDFINLSDYEHGDDNHPIFS